MSSAARAVPGGMMTSTIAAMKEDVTRLRAGKTDGRLFPVVPEDLVKGNVLTTVEDGGHSHSFSDCVIVDVYDVDRSGKKVFSADAPKAVPEYRTVRLARPYAYVSSADTACPSVLQGFEEYTVFVADLVKKDSRYRVRCQSTGKVDRMVT